MKVGYSFKNFEIFSSILIGVGVYFLLLIRYGFEIGTGDHAEFAPFILQLNDNTLYTKDFFIQSMNSMPWNERKLFSLFFGWFYPFHESVFFIAHVFTSISLILGIFYLADFLLKSKLNAWLVVVLVLLLLNDITCGGNTLYYNNISGGLIAKAALTWAIYFIVKRNYIGFLFAGLTATFFQPFVSFQFLIAISIPLILQILFSPKKPNLLEFSAIGIYYLSTLFVVFNIYTSQTAGNCPILNQEFINIIFNFRMPHHYNPAVFSRKGYILLGIVLLVGLYFYYKTNKTLFYFLVIIYLGLFVYLIGNSFNNYMIISSWWFRTTIWIKLLGIVAIVGLTNQLKVYSFKLKLVLYIILPVSLGVLICHNTLVGFKVAKFHFGNSNRYPEIDISSKAKELTGKKACFIQPFFFSELKYYGQRSSYVEFHRIVRNRCDVKEWMGRINEVYDINSNSDIRQSDFMKSVNTNFQILTTAQLKKLKDKGVTHLITFEEVVYPDFKLLYKNRLYRLYEL